MHTYSLARLVVELLLFVGYWMTKLGADYGRMRTYNPATVVKKAPAVDTADEETLPYFTQLCS